ncbi:MAG: zf-HC2 domain-containing protein [Xanthomonadales bacterium]|jgi:predicted anti-sigma-YlaC factor YlaD|nr:zf-HC2 domain-containing protein [Xanthomonadales bacterium]
MNNSNGGEAHVGERLSGYLDGELTQQEKQRVDLHLADCADCRGLLRELEGLRRRMGRSGLSQKYEDEWRENMDDTGVKLTRGIGWLLLIGAVLIVAAVIVFQFITDPGISGFMKFLIGAFYLGLAALFVSVLRQRLIERKTDRYKDVEI